MNIRSVNMNGKMDSWRKKRYAARPCHIFLSMSLYRWFFRLLEEYLTVFPIGRMMALEMGFRLELGKNKVRIRKPDLAVILHSNPVESKPLDRSFGGVCDLCIEFLSDSDSTEVERDTVHKKEEYAQVERLRALLQDKDSDPS